MKWNLKKTIKKWSSSPKPQEDASKKSSADSLRPVNGAEDTDGESNFYI